MFFGCDGSTGISLVHDWLKTHCDEIWSNKMYMLAFRPAISSQYKICRSTFLFIFGGFFNNISQCIWFKNLIASESFNASFASSTKYPFISFTNGPTNNAAVYGTLTHICQLDNRILFSENFSYQVDIVILSDGIFPLPLYLRVQCTIQVWYIWMTRRLFSTKIPTSLCT